MTDHDPQGDDATLTALWDAADRLDIDARCVMCRTLIVEHLTRVHR